MPRAAPVPPSSARAVQRALAALANPRRAPLLQRFFKTGPGEYGEGDRFRGLTVPDVRAVVRAAGDVPTGELEKLLASPWHEDRLAGLLIAVRRGERGDDAVRGELFRFYLAAARAGRVNNWDLVDASAAQVVGGWLFGRADRRRVLERLAASNNLWERRIAVIATFHFIRRREFGETLRLAERLLGDPHDLMHKAVGWMLRETGNRDRALLDEFLAEFAPRLPRTALRYAIEKHSPAERKRWLAVPRAPR